MNEVSTEKRLFRGRFLAVDRLKQDRGIETLLGVDQQDGSPVVIKTASDGSVAAGMQMRLEHEAQVLGGIESPYLTPLLDVGRERGTLFLVMPFVAGGTLQRRLEAGALTVREALTVATCLMTALCDAHDRGVLHRDVKPANVIVDEGSPIERATLIDFGLARSTRLDVTIRDLAVGTANYMSPEQAGLLHHEVDERSDLYSAGALIFECLAGRPPFKGQSVREVLRHHMTTDPPELRALGEEIPQAFSALVNRLLRKDPRDRYQSAEAVLVDLRRISRALDRGDPDPEIVVGLNDRRRTLTEPAFVGRDEELSALEAEVARAQTGDGGLVMLEAESGGGKSRLLDELARRLGGRNWALRGQGLDQVGQSPLQVIDGVCRELVAAAGADPALRERLLASVEGRGETLVAAVPRLAELLGEASPSSLGPEEHGELRAVRALVALFDALGTETQPAVVLLDDCQWADELTIHLIRAWREQAPAPGSRRHVVLVVAFRSEEVSPGHPLRNLEPSLHLTLAPLGPSDTALLLESMSGTLPDEAVELVLRLSDGSPFMAGEILRGLVETGALIAGPAGWCIEPELMAGVQSSRRAAAFIRRRLERMPASLLRLLSLGAVLGKEFELEAVGALAGADAGDVVPALRAAELRKVIWSEAHGTRYSFVHDKLREALLERLSLEERRELHLAAARRIESVDSESAERDRSFRLAYHFDAAGDSERALPHALAAAEQARARHALEIAEHQYRIAEPGATVADVATRRRVAEGLGDVLMLRGSYEEAAGQFSRAHTLAAGEVERARINSKLGDLHLKRGDVKRASEWIERGLLLLGQPVPRWRPALLVALLKEIVVQLLHTVLPSLFVSRRPLDRGEVDLLAVRLYSRLAHSYWFERGRVPCAWAHLREMNLAERYPPTLELAQAYSEHAPVMTMVPLYRRGLAYAERSLAIRKQQGDVWGQGQSLNFWGIGLYAASRFEPAIAKFREAIRIFDRTGDRWEANTAGWHLAFCLYRLGSLAEAVETAQRIHAAGLELGDTQASGISLGAWSKASGGQVPRKIVHAELERPSDDVHRTAEVLQAEAVRLIGDGRPGEAVEVLERARKLVCSAGLRQEYVAPVTPWLATALRQQAESVSLLAPGERSALLRRARRVARTAARTARSFQNNLPHALRERALIEAMHGRGRRARRLFDASLVAAERQSAAYERAQTLLARARAGVALGWRDAAEDDSEGRTTLHELGKGLEHDEDAAEPVTISLLERFTGVLEVGRLIASALTRDAVFAAVRDSALILLRGEYCTLLEVARGGDTPGVRAVEGFDTGSWSRSIVERVIDTGEPVLFSEDSGEESSESAILARAPSVLCAPILVRGEIAACFYVVNEDVGDLFTDEEERLAQFISALAGAALENAEGFAEVAELSRSLEERVRERSTELSQANVELKQEISERKHAESVLRRSEERFRSFMESAPDAVVIIRPDGEIVVVNAQAEKLFGYARDELLGKPVETLLPERAGHCGKRSSYLADYLADPRTRPMGAGLDLFGRRSDGSEFPVDISLSPLETDQGTLIASAIRNITERRRAEMYIAAQSAVSNVLAQSSTYEEAMPRCLEALGREMGWVLGQLWTVERDSGRLLRRAAWYSPDIAAQGFDAVSETTAFARGEGLPGRVWESQAPTTVQDVTRDLNFPRADAAREANLRGAFALPLLGKDRFLGVIELFSPDLKETDERMVEMMVTVGAQIGQFIERKGAEREAQRLKDEFFSLVSHEFRTPLTSIVGYVELLQSEDEFVSESERNEFLEVVKRNSERLRRLVDDLLFISKVQAGKFSITPRALDIGELMHHAVDSARPLAERAGIELAFRAEAMPPLRGDPDRLAQLFDNLISNAVKYTPPGERIEVTLSNGGQRTLARVRNTGAHIPAADLEKLFEPFFRSSTASVCEAAGIGLGLTIARSIAEAHGGRIAVESALDAGTTFTVDLPLRGADDEPMKGDAVAA